MSRYLQAGASKECPFSNVVYGNHADVVRFLCGIRTSNLTLKAVEEAIEYLSQGFSKITDDTLAQKIAVTLNTLGSTDRIDHIKSALLCFPRDITSVMPEIFIENREKPTVAAVYYYGRQELFRREEALLQGRDFLKLLGTCRTTEATHDEKSE